MRGVVLHQVVELDTEGSNAEVYQGRVVCDCQRLHCGVSPYITLNMHTDSAAAAWAATGVESGDCHTLLMIGWFREACGLEIPVCSMSGQCERSR